MNRDIMDIACVGGNGGFSIVDRAGLNACVWPAGIVVYYGDISPSLLSISMPWPVWLIYDLYPSLEAVAVALSGFDGGWVLMVLENMCSLHNNMFLSLVWLVSQHEGILLYLIIKSIKETSMLERLDSSWLWLHGGGCTVC